MLTTSQAPEQAVLTGIAQILQKAGIAASDVGIIIHGTTLATNAIIERKGARTALLVTEGFRDSVEMAFENRFEQYDLYMDRRPRWCRGRCAFRFPSGSMPEATSCARRTRPHCRRWSRH